MTSTSRRRPVGRLTVIEVDGTEARRRPDTVVAEEPMEVRLSWPGRPAHRVAVTMRTPGHDFELAAGYLLTEGVIDTTPRTVAYCLDPMLGVEQEYNVVTVDLNGSPLRPPPARAATISSACGVCGVDSLDEVYAPDQEAMPVRRTLDPETLHALPERLRVEQAVFDRTGALHAAGVFGADGSLRVVREDVGRHNAVDKVFGARLLGDVDFGADDVLCVSGRIGFDIMTKAVTGGVGAVLGVGAPSSLAVDLADRAGVTLIGFARRRRYVVYTHPARLGV